MAEGLGGAESPGSWLRHQRQAAGLTQEELAARSGLGIRTISDLERGVRSPYPRSLRLVAGALGMSETAAYELVAWYRAAGNGGTVLPGEAINGGPKDLPQVPLNGTPGRASDAPAVVPRQLPMASAYFAGRAAELATLDGWIEQLPGANGAVVISAICGMAGVGKTALALRWAHQVAEGFPDGQLYVNLRGYGPGRRPSDPAEVIRSFLGALGLAPEWIPADPDGQVGLYRSVLAGKRVLIVADNARDAEQVRMLLPGTPGCLVLVTSRSPLTGLVAVEGARVLTLDVPTVAEAGELLSARLGGDRVEAEPTAVYELIGACGGLPLALAVIAARAAVSGWPLATLAAGLADASERLGVLEHSDPRVSVKAVFSWSYRYLGHAAARVFRLLGIHPGPEMSCLAVASLAGLPSRLALAALRELADVSLIAEPAPGRYALHDLLRAYATEQAGERDTGEERRAAAHRMLDYYLHSAWAAVGRLYPAAGQVAIPALSPGTTPERPADPGEALAWLQAEHQVLQAVTVLAAEGGFDDHAWRLAAVLQEFFARHGHHLDWARSQRAALAAAARVGDEAARASAHRGLGEALIRLGTWNEAGHHLDDALRLYSGLGDDAGQAGCHSGMGRLALCQDDYAQALHHAQRALRLYRAAGDVAGQAAALNGVGWDYALLGNNQRAFGYCRKALELYREADDRFGEAATLDSLGYCHHQAGQYGQAVPLYQQALGAYADAGDRYYAAHTLIRLGDAHTACGDQQAACQVWQEALDILDGLHHHDAEAIRAKLHDMTEALSCP